MRRILVLTFIVLFGLNLPSVGNVSTVVKPATGLQEQELISANIIVADDFYDEWEEDDDWEDEDLWDEDDDFYGDAEDDERELAPTRAASPRAPAPPARQSTTRPAKVTASSKSSTTTTSPAPAKVASKTPEEASLEEKIQQDLEAAKDKRKQDYIKLANTFKRSTQDFENLYSQYGDLLSGLDPENPKDLKEIEKLIEIVGIPKRERKAQRGPTLKAAPTEDPVVNFSARNIPTRDAFATLARVSGKSITVSGTIQDRDTISVVEINDQPFTKAFLSLVEAAGVDFSRSGDSYTILKKRGAKSTSLLTGLDTTDIDLSLPLEERYADLTYDNEDLSSIIKDLSNKYGVDIVMTANPTERITLKVRGVNIEEAFELLFSGSQFDYTRKIDTFVVYSSANKNFSLDKKTILFPLKYLEAQEAQKLLPAELKNLVQVSENQNAFIAEGSKSELTQLYDFIRTIDKPIPQVELNVKLVEVSKDFRRANSIFAEPFSIGRLGKEIFSSTAGAATNGAAAATGNLLGIRGLRSNFGDEEWSVFANRPTYSQTSANQQIKVNQRLLVTSGKSAKINFDEDVNVVLNSGENPNPGAGVVQNQRIQRITAGNSMDITPIVGGGGVVTVKVEVEVSANGTIQERTGVPDKTVRRRISSEIQISNHETIAIGGLFDDRKGRARTNEIPLLSKIPIIGDLFGNSSKDKNLKELLILITPHIRTGEDTEEIYIQASN